MQPMMRKVHYRIYAYLPFLEKRAQIIISLPQNPILVDLGCNIGRNLEGFRILRNDLSIHAIDCVDFSAILKDKGCIFHQIDLLKDALPFDAGTVDCIMATHILEHLPNPYHLLAEAKRVLKRKGKVFIEAPGVRSLFVPSFHSSRSRQRFTFNFFDDPTHLRPFSVGGLQRLIEDTGFKVVECGISRNWLFFSLSPLLLLSGLFNRFLFHAGLINLIGWSVYCVAEIEK